MDSPVIISPAFAIGQIVYLKTDLEQYPRMVYAYMVYSEDHIIYKIAQGTNISDHYEFELSEDKNILLKMTS